VLNKSIISTLYNYFLKKVSIGSHLNDHNEAGNVLSRKSETKPGNIIGLIFVKCYPHETFIVGFWGRQIKICDEKMKSISVRPEVSNLWGGGLQTKMTLLL